MKLRAVPLALVVMISFSSCALVLTGRYQRMNIVSEPPDAEVWINDEFVDSTPCVVRLKRNYDRSPEVEIRKSGYRTERPKLKRTFNEVASLNFILPWNWLIDGFSGAAMRYRQIDTVALKAK